MWGNKHLKNTKPVLYVQKHAVRLINKVDAEVETDYCTDIVFRIVFRILENEHF